MIVIDTSVMVDAFTRDRRAKAELRGAFERGERLLMPTLVLYEWLRGPRRPEELAAQEGLLPSAGAIPFSDREAEIAARLYRTVARARTRGVDLAIAAHAVAIDAELWTFNVTDFEDIPDLALFSQ